MAARLATSAGAMLGRALPSTISRRAFSGMSTAGLSQTQRDTRETVMSICAKYPDAYWTEKDSKGEYAGDDLHRDLAEAGLIGICMPESVGGIGLGIAEASQLLLAVAESGAGIAGAQTIHAKCARMN